MAKPKSIKALRDFGLVMAIACVLVAALLLYKSKAVTLVSFVLLLMASGFGAFTFFAPEKLRRPEALWMAFGERISVVMTFVIMFLSFLLVLTPLSLLRRLFQGEVMPLSFDKEAESYWVDSDKEGTAKRFFNPY